MASFAGLQLRSAGERSYDRGEAEGTLTDIERAEEDFLKTVDAWARRHPHCSVDRDAFFDYLGDFLVDCFAAGRRDAAEELGEEEANSFDAARARMISALVAGEPL